MAELRCERVLGKCEVCGAEGEINRYSRTIQGYLWHSKEKDKVFTFKRGAVRQICDSCLLKGIENLLDASDARTSPNSKEVKPSRSKTWLRTSAKGWGKAGQA